MKLLVLLLLSGCEVVFPLDSRQMPDAAVNGDGALCVGHDEDGDGKVDICDNCPTVKNADQAIDDDQDSVGTACDPFTGPVDRISFYSAFVDDTGLNLGGAGATFDGSAEGGITLTKVGGVTTAEAVMDTREVILQLGIGTGQQALEIRLATLTGGFCRISNSGCSDQTCIEVDSDGNGAMVGAAGGVGTAFGSITELRMYEAADGVHCDAVGIASIHAPGTMMSGAISIIHASDGSLTLHNLIAYSH